MTSCCLLIHDPTRSYFKEVVSLVPLVCGPLAVIPSFNLPFRIPGGQNDRSLGAFVRPFTSDAGKAIRHHHHIACVKTLRQRQPA